MDYRRVIPCLDYKDGFVVKGVNFENVKSVADPVVLAKKYCEQGADELVLLDIAATVEGRPTLMDVVKRVLSVVTVPFAVGGGISSVSHIGALLELGVSKVGINSAAVKNPALISEASKEFGSKFVVSAIDARPCGDGKYEVCTHGGMQGTGIDAFEWAKHVASLGACEILLTGTNTDGMKTGFDIAMLKGVSSSVDIPVIASGGAGKLEHFYSAIVDGGADAVLAASLFHFKELSVMDVKKHLQTNGVKVRL